MHIVIGVDGCKSGWVFIRLENGVFAAAELYQHFAAGVNASLDATVIGVDMPIGYPPPPAAQRQADVDARILIGPHSSSVFPAPHPDVLGAPNWQAANQISHARIDRGLSRQSFALSGKILEVEVVAARDERVYEVHPEVSFWALACRHLATSKKQWNGHAERRALLAAHGIEIPEDLGNAGTATADDILDAAAAAWSAHRIDVGKATSVPAPPERDAAGRRVAIWY